MTLARGQEGPVQTVNVKQMVSTTHLYWRILRVGIARPVQMINVNIEIWLTKTHVTLVRGQEEVERTVRVLQMDIKMRLF